MIQFTPILAKIISLDFKKLLPILPYAVCLGVGWFANGYRLDSNRIEAELKSKDIAIEQANIRANAATELAVSKDLIVQEYKDAKEASDARVSGLESNLVNLSLRQPKDTTRIIDNTRNLTDDIIRKDDTYSWLRELYPDELLDTANRRIADSKHYGLPVPALVGYPATKSSD